MREEYGVKLVRVSYAEAYAKNVEVVISWHTAVKSGVVGCVACVQRLWGMLLRVVGGQGGRVGCGITRSPASATLACRNRFNHRVTPIDGANIWHSERFKSTQNLFGPRVKSIKRACSGRSLLVQQGLLPFPSAKIYSYIAVLTQE